MLEVHFPIERVYLILSIGFSVDEVKGEGTVKPHLAETHVGKEESGRLDQDLHLLRLDIDQVDRLLTTRNDERELLEIEPRDELKVPLAIVVRGGIDNLLRCYPVLDDEQVCNP